MQRADVTRGALYHHFRDKEDLFRAVFEDVESELSERVVVAGMRGRDPIERLRLGLDAFLDACLEPAVQRIVLQEGPSVLGWEMWYEIDTRHAHGLIAHGLQEAMDAGVLPRQPVDALAHLFMGAVTQAGMVVAGADEPAKAKAKMSKAFRGLLDAIRSG